MDREEYLRRVKSYIKTPTKDMEEQLNDFCSKCSYVSGQYDQDDSFINLRQHLEELEGGRKETNRVFYMALPPSVFITVSQHLKKNVYPKHGIARIIVSYQSPPAFQRPHTDQDIVSRLRSRLARTFRALGSCNEHWRQTGRKMRSSVLITTWARRW